MPQPVGTLMESECECRFFFIEHCVFVRASTFRILPLESERFDSQFATSKARPRRCDNRESTHSSTPLRSQIQLRYTQARLLAQMK